MDHVKAEGALHADMRFAMSACSLTPQNGHLTAMMVQTNGLQASKGGLRDKPGKPPDYYHTCYCLSGLSASQHCSGKLVGSKENLLNETDLLLNVCVDRLAAARSFWSS